MPSVIRPGYMYPTGHDDPLVEAVINLLEDWFQAMESGTITLRLPASPETYHRPSDKPWWTEEALDLLITDIDAEIDMEVNRAPGTQPLVKAQAGSGFSRLLPPQRLALAQQLEQVLLAYGVGEGAKPEVLTP